MRCNAFENIEAGSRDVCQWLARMWGLGGQRDSDHFQEENSLSQRIPTIQLGLNHCQESCSRDVVNRVLQSQGSRAGQQNAWLHWLAADCPMET